MAVTFPRQFTLRREFERAWDGDVRWSTEFQVVMSGFDLNYSLHAQSREQESRQLLLMDANLPQSKSVPSNLTTTRWHRVSISVSGSYQSHLSSLGHLHRVRTASEQISLGPVESEKDDLRVLEDGLAEQRSRTGRFCVLKQFLTDPTGFLSDDLRRIRSGHVWRLRTLFALYCCLCVVFLTVKIHAFSREVLCAARPATRLVETDVRGVSSLPFMNITLSQRLSVAFRYLPPQAHLDTFVVQARPGHTSELTACLWIEDARVEEALASATTWPGPVSLVIVTTNAPTSIGYKNLLGYLATNQRHAPSNASMHVLHVPSVAGTSSNVYLNMARFFARTPRVVLFPDGIPKSALLDHAPWLDKLPVNAPHPVLLSNTTHRAFPSRLLAPILLPKDHPVWCTERFYMFGSRILDWEDCLWNFWLESAGEAPSIAVPHLLDGSKNATSLTVSPYAIKIRLRWSTKYRSEACAFTLKRSQALESLSKTEKRHMHWRKKFCRETVGPAALDIS